MTSDLENTDHEEFVSELANQCKTHEQWVSLVRFGLPTLLKEQSLLMKIIVLESERRSSDTFSLPLRANQILGELGLRLTVVPPPPCS